MESFAAPARALVAEMTQAAAADPAMERAIRFGVEQILVQHGGLWSLLESREFARRH